jgi:hypothetical protein
MDEKAGACRDAALQLGQCMEEKSPCVKAGGLISECVKTAAGVAGCEAYHRAYFECRRAQLDMRARIRGKRFVDSASNAAQ